MKFDNRHLPNPLPALPSNYNLRREAWLVAYAETSCQIVEALSGLLSNGDVPEHTPAYFGVVNTVYVVYGRPFHRCGGVGLLEKADIPPNCHATHDHLMTFRDKVYGHKDSEGIQIDKDYTANEVRATVGKDGQMRIFCTEFYTRPPKMPDIQGHVAALQSHFGAKMNKLVAELCHGMNPSDGGQLYDGEFILSLDWREETPFKRVPDRDAYVYRKG